ncbi:transferase, partial [Salmonella enterica subsp. enterica serovar Haifa]|nr:transferase [Salmonella enterica subsp. enterica serovar Haifa]
MGKNYVDIENDHGATLRYRKHANGRGLVAHGAKVHPKAHIEAGAYIEPGARVG